MQRAELLGSASFSFCLGAILSVFRVSAVNNDANPHRGDTENDEVAQRIFKLRHNQLLDSRCHCAPKEKHPADRVFMECGAGSPANLILARVIFFRFHQHVERLINLQVHLRLARNQ